MAPSPKQALLLLILCNLYVSGVLADKSTADPQNMEELLTFFRKIDSDGDGEIAQEETNNYMDMHGVESEGYTTVAEGAARGGAHQVEETFSYGGTTISSGELTSHLQHMLTGEHVADWITHGVRLPQYSAAFRENSIDGQDFPALLSDNQTALQDDLRVQSPLHRNKIHAAIFRQVFGIGSMPAVPQQLECKATPCGSIQLQWDPPANLGVPPVHKFLVQRRPMHTHALWVLVGDPTDDTLLDGGVATGVGYRYRIQSWGGHGPSDWVEVDGCGTDVEFDGKCSTEGWDYGAALAGWRGGAGRRSSNRWGSQGGQGGSEADPQTSMQRYLIAVGVVLFGVAVRNTLFWDVLIRVVGRSWDLYGKSLLERHRALKSSTFWAARLLSSCLDALFWVWKATAVRAAFFIWGVAVGRQQKAASIPGAEEGNGIQEGSGRAGDAGGESVGASSEHQVAGSDGALLLAVQEGGGEVERGAEMRFCKSDTDLNRPSSSTVIGSGEEGSDVSLPRGSRRSTSSDNMAASVEGGSGRGQGREGGSGRSSQSEDREAEEDREMAMVDPREAAMLKGKGRCNAKGCELRFDRWKSLRDWGNSRNMHYCRGCQGAFCLAHTRYANHEGLTGCAIHTQCLCFPCFYRYPIDTQTAFNQVNRLKRRHMNATSATSLPGLSSRRDTSPPGNLVRVSSEGGGGGGLDLKSFARSKTRAPSKTSLDSDTESADEPSPRTSSETRMGKEWGLGSGRWNRRRSGGMEGSTLAVDRRMERRGVRMEEEKPQRRLSTSSSFHAVRASPLSGTCLYGEQVCDSRLTPSCRCGQGRERPPGTLVVPDWLSAEGLPSPTPRLLGHRRQSSSMPGVSGAGVDDGIPSTNPQKTLALRWRMSLMWALENRGAADSAARGMSSPQPQPETGGVGGGGDGREWGKSKPPLPPTEAQRRWLMAGRWALGKELDSQEQEGGRLQGVPVRSASERNATPAVQAPSPTGISEQPGMKRRVSKQFWRNLTATPTPNL